MYVCVEAQQGLLATWWHKQVLGVGQVFLWSEGPCVSKVCARLQTQMCLHLGESGITGVTEAGRRGSHL